MGTCSGHQVGTCKEEKTKPSPRPGHHCPTKPLHHFSEVVWTANQLKPPSSWHLISTTFPLQTQQHRIGPHINPHSPQKNHQPTEKLPPKQTSITVVIMFIVRNPPSLQVSIQYLKHKCKKDHTHRDSTCGFGILLSGTVVNAEWVDASAVEIVEEIRGHEKESFEIGEVLA